MNLLTVCLLLIPILCTGEFSFDAIRQEVRNIIRNFMNDDKVLQELNNKIETLERIQNEKHPDVVRTIHSLEYIPMKGSIFGQLGKWCYYFEHVRRGTWMESSNECEKMEAHLVVLETAEESKELRRYLLANLPAPRFRAADDFFWIGAYRNLSEKIFMWKDGEPITYNSWGPDRPEYPEGVDTCMEMSPFLEYRWNDRNCKHRGLFICEMSCSTVEQ